MQLIRFKEHLNSHEPKEVLSTEEYEELRALCRQSQKAERAEQAQEEEAERPPGEEEPATPEGTDTVSLDCLMLTLRGLSHKHGERKIKEMTKNILYTFCV